ncbi:MAG: hypothetical protein IPJ36_12080 [Simplicispira sp.]|nr:hypothetical protein [Simplicispira sp.]
MTWIARQCALLVQRAAQSFARECLQRTGLAFNLSHQTPHHRALAFDHAAHALELFGVRVASRFETKQSAFFGEGLFELNASVLRGPLPIWSEPSPGV